VTIRVLIADDQALIREGFAAILGRSDDIEIVGEAIDGQAAVEASRRLRPDVVLMDIRMPVLDGIAACETISRDPALAATRVIVVTTFDLDENVYAALRAGASGFLLKDLEPDELRHAVRVVASGDALLAPAVTRRLIGRFVDETQGAVTAPNATAQPREDERIARLTEREREVVILIAAGLSNAEIATRLFISPTTVKTHSSHAMIKTGSRDRAQLVVFAYESGLVR
jgi:DNA-binding NarL/FixJ family response regulator